MTIGNGVVFLGYYTFAGCHNLTEVIIPDSVTSVGPSVFEDCSGLTKVTIGNSVTFISNKAFSGCYSLTSVISLNTTPPEISSEVFDQTTLQTATLYVPKGSKARYEQAEHWKDFLNIQEPTIVVSVNADGLATYCPQYDIDFSTATEIAAYKASVSDNTVTLTRVKTVAAGEGVLLRSLNGGATTEEVPVTADATANENNAFVGTQEAIVLYETEGSATNFVLSKKDGVVGFYKANNTPIAAGKAYLPVENYNAARGLTVVFDDDVTGISEVKQATVEEDAVYTLDGVRVKTPVKGLYIKNGKKVILR